MTSPDSGRLSYLLKEVRAARSPAARLRIAARTWRILRRLTPKERADFAAELGLHGAGDALERLAAGPAHEMAAELTALADRAEKTEPQRVRSLLTELRDPAKRHELVEHGLHTLADQVAELLGGDRPEEEGQELGGEDEAMAGPRRPAGSGVRPPGPVPEASRQEGTSWTRDDVKQVRDPEGFRKVAAVPGAVGPGREEWLASTAQAAAAGAAVRAAEAIAATTASPAVPEAVGTPSGGQAPGPAAVPPAAPPLAAAAATLHSPAPATPTPSAAGGTWDAVAPSAPEAPAPSPALPSSSTSDALDAPPPATGTSTAPPGLTARFRALRRRLAAFPPPGDAELADLLGAFAPGWTHRRALTAVLQAGLPKALDQAAGLVLALPSPTDRRWCWSALLAGRTLSPAEHERLASAEPSPRVRRRLAPVRDRMGRTGR